MTFYGESYRHVGVHTVTGATVDGASLVYHFDGLSHTVEAGAAFIAGVEAEPLNLTDTDAAVVSWVIETGPASAGTLTVASGLDPDWTGSDPADATQPLGSFEVAGEQTIVAGPTSLTVADLLTFAAEPIALVTVTSGVVEVVQVKLRVWPPGGAGGSWVSGPAWTRSDFNVSRWYGALNEGTAQLPTYAEAWDALKAVISTWDGRAGIEYGPTPGGASVQSFFQVFDNFATAPFTPSGSAGASIALVSASPGSAAPDPSLDYGYDPREVWREARAAIRAVGGGDAVPAFVEWDAAATLTVASTRVGSVDLGGPPDLEPHPSNPAFRVGPFHHPPSFAERDGAVPLSELGGQHVALAVMAPGYYDGPPTADSFTSASGALSSSLPYLVSISDYEWFDPAATAVQPRFYVKHRDDSMRPVGFGKPATELTVFRVPGGGRWRDLTTDEYATYGPTARPPGGVALKVKRLDAAGSPWWDHVAWMVPDA